MFPEAVLAVPFKVTDEPEHTFEPVPADTVRAGFTVTDTATGEL
jgi:hypothetical protein